MRRLAALIVVAACASWIQHVHSETLSDVYELALLNDADFRAAEADLRATLQTLPQARSALRPQVNLGGDATWQDIDSDDDAGDDSFTSSEISISLNQALYRRALGAAVDQVDATVAQARAQFEGAEEALILRVAEAYFDVLAALDNLDFAQAEKEAIAQQLEQAQRRFEVGLIAITDVKEAQARYDLSVAQEIEADNNLSLTRQALLVLTGAPVGLLARLRDDTPLVRPDPDDIEQWVATAQERNLALIAARHATEAARERIEVNRSDRYPTVDLVGRYAVRDADGGFNEGGSRNASISVQLDYPLYTGGGTSADIRQARAQFDSAREALEKQRRTTVQQARGTFLSVIAAISRVRALRQALASTQAGAEATQAGFEVGTRTAVEVLIALQETYRAQRDYARARYDYVLNLLRLKQAAGILQPDDLHAWTDWLQ